jgi:hypothetical protein
VTGRSEPGRGFGVLVVLAALAGVVFAAWLFVVLSGS